MMTVYKLPKLFLIFKNQKEARKINQIILDIVGMLSIYRWNAMLCYRYLFTNVLNIFLCKCSLDQTEKVPGMTILRH